MTQRGTSDRPRYAVRRMPEPYDFLDRWQVVELDDEDWSRS